MELGTLIETGTSELGARLKVVGFLPLATLSLLVLALVWSGAPANAPDLALVVERAGDLTPQGVLFITAALLITALLLQPLQLSLVRLLEGYWGMSFPGAALSRVGVAIQKRRRRKLDAMQTITNPQQEPSEEELALMALAGWRLRRYFPAERRLLPTTLGNVLRAAEDLAGGRYGLDAVVVWPRLYPLLPSEMKLILNDQRDQLDFAARFCVIFLLATGASLGLLYRHAWWLAVPVATSFLAWLSYRAAIATALGYGESIQAAFDLYRFDLLEALHLPLPTNRDDEKEANKALCDFLRQGIPLAMNYVTPGEAKAVAKSSDGSKATERVE